MKQNLRKKKPIAKINLPRGSPLANGHINNSQPSAIEDKKLLLIQTERDRRTTQLNSSLLTTATGEVSLNFLPISESVFGSNLS